MTCTPMQIILATGGGVRPDLYVLNTKKKFFFNIKHRQDGTESSTGYEKADAERPKN